MISCDVNTINVHELKNRLDKNVNLLLIDVREDYEWQALRIPGTVHIPKNELVARIESNTSDRNCPIYLHCRGGVRSLEAAQYLLQMGYKEVYSIEGGIVDWECFGYPTEK